MCCTEGFQFFWDSKFVIHLYICIYIYTVQLYIRILYIYVYIRIYCIYLCIHILYVTFVLIGTVVITAAHAKHFIQYFYCKVLG